MPEPFLYPRTILDEIVIFRDTKKSHNAQLRAACEAALKEIQEMVGADNNSEGDDDK